MSTRNIEDYEREFLAKSELMDYECDIKEALVYVHLLDFDKQQDYMACIEQKLRKYEALWVQYHRRYSSEEQDRSMEIPGPLWYVKKRQEEVMWGITG